MHVAILLIGGNPLPNYVVANYLIQQNRPDEQDVPCPDHWIWVYSDETARFVTPLRKALGLNKSQIKEVPLKKCVRDAEKIFQEIQVALDEVAKTLQTAVTSIHLNYTGGTKAMSVQGYIAVTDWIKHYQEKHKTAVSLRLSDLDPDPKKHVLRVHLIENNLHRVYPPEDLRQKIRLSVEELFQLHDMDMSRWKPGETQALLPEKELYDFARQAVAWLKNEDQKRLLQIFNQNILEGAKTKFDFQGKRRDEDKEAFIRQNQSQFDANLRIIRATFPGITQYFEYIKHHYADQTPHVKFLEFFSGKWLEDIVLVTLQQLQKQGQPIHDLRKGVEPMYRGRPCEVDVLALRGYQLFYFSCTTSQRIDIVKQKAFEAEYRAQQLGGEHAKFTVVSAMSDNLDRLQKDLQQFDAYRNGSLIGLQAIDEELQGQGTLSTTLTKILEEGKA